MKTEQAVYFDCFCGSCVHFPEAGQDQETIAFPIANVLVRYSACPRIFVSTPPSISQTVSHKASMSSA